MCQDTRLFRLAIAALIFYFILPETWLDFVRKRPYFSDHELKRIALTFKAPELPEFTESEYQVAQLGRKIFFDTRFSKNEMVACASCHIPALHFTDRVATAEGIDIGQRNTPSLVNLAWADWFFWDGRADSLEAQALQPLEAANEHGISRGRAVQLIYHHYLDEYQANFPPLSQDLSRFMADLADSEWQATPGPLTEGLSFDSPLSSYGVATIGSFRIQTRLIREAHNHGTNPQTWFSKLAFVRDPPPAEWVDQYQALSTDMQEEVNRAFWNIGRSLATFQRGITAIDSSFDRFLLRLATAENIEDAFDTEFSEKHWQGFKHFIQGDCISCHHGPMFTDNQFHNIGLEQLGDELALGRAVGASLVQHDTFRCGFQQDGYEKSESCLELEFLRLNHQEALGAFKTPSLRNVGLTSPYMHDGRFASLDEVLDHYNQLPVQPAIGHREETLRPLQLRQDELASLKAFLLSLDAPVRSHFERETEESRVQSSTR